MDESQNDIDLVVGSMIITRPDEDRDTYEDDLEKAQDIQDLLREEGVEVDLTSQPGTQIWEGSIRSYYDLYELRRLAAHLERGDDVKIILTGAVANGEDMDELLVHILDDEAPTRFPHLIKHPGLDIYYLPAEFSEPIWIGYGSEEEDGDISLEEDEVSFGSSIALLHELTEVQALFDQHGIPLGGARDALQALKTAAEQSMNNGLVVIFW